AREWPSPPDLWPSVEATLQQRFHAGPGAAWPREDAPAETQTGQATPAESLEPARSWPRELGKMAAGAALVALLALVLAAVYSGQHGALPGVGEEDVAPAGGEVVTGDELLRNANVAVRRAKANGGNRVELFDDALRLAEQERSSIGMSLRRAIDEGQMVLHYQPEFDLLTGEVLAVEALVRWNHPQRGLTPPNEFIGIAEETGLIVDLGHWVLEEACRTASRFRRLHPDHELVMRVNLSPAQLSSRNIVQLVAQCLEDNELPGRLLCLEITENAVMQNLQEATETLHALRSLGVSLAIDDFGTGFSTMSQLKQLPVDALKVDQSFVFGIGTDGGDRAIVDATIRLGRSFGLDVVAEGIETAQIMQQLMRLGCNRGQGFLFMRPCPPDDLVELLARGHLLPIQPR
ncbi:MAG: putative bifunctional diguanylate cyclase/phosphodiesterase, partial [Acidimicrobiales bacterium]